jgi:hypothetical protein
VFTVYKKTDVSTWETDFSLNAGGTRAKIWKVNPENGQLVLVKWAKYNNGEIYAEKLASEIGK